jgi:hypothetical protein
MPDPAHVHVCPQPYCLTSWSHQEIRCTWAKEHICDRHTRQELENFLSARDSDFLATWIAADDEQAKIDRYQDMETELERMRLLLEDEQECDDANLRAHAETIQKELKANEVEDLQRDFLERELKICHKEIARRQMEPIERGKANESQAEIRVPTVEFMVESGEFSKALRYLRPARARGRKARADFVDLNARTGDVEIVAPGVSFSLPSQVISAGYARVPYLTFEWFAKALGTIRQPSVVVWIADGQVRAENLTFTHPDISIRLMGARIADLPIDAPLPDVLALLVKFRPEELSDSGLLARVLAAQETVSELIDRAMKVLAPLETKHEELSQFIWEQIKKRNKQGPYR